VRVGRGAGLDAVGTCSAEPFVRTREVLEARREAGLSGTMAFTYRNPARSTDPSATLEGAASLVVAALRYPTEVPPPPDRPAGRVGRYATADHYGRLRAGLDAVADVLRDSGFVARVLADDNALVDRAAAYRAGLGWFGKNSNLLLEGRGSWFVLGSVLTTADLGPSPEPVPDGCGVCRRCIDGCPTGAIVADGVVDARRCLAWLVQASGPFPSEARVALGDRIYGCDECQEVCPPNRVSERVGDGPASEPPPAAPGSWVDVEWLLTAPDDELLHRGRLGRWYVPDRDASVLRRNALIVLGNIADPTDPVVERLLTDYLDGADDLLAGHAAWAALRLGRGDVLVGQRAQRPAVAAEMAAAPPIRQDARP
ncbi:MAG: tRNA epoxyqueuosine(34) reductase QueG, partial [Actinomycetes bacterium]